MAFILFLREDVSIHRKNLKSFGKSPKSLEPEENVDRLSFDEQFPSGQHPVVEEGLGKHSIHSSHTL